MMKKIIILLLLLLVAIAVVPFFLPKTIHQEAEHIYEQDLPTVYNAFANVQKFSEWFEWEAKENTKHQYSKPAEGASASYVWKDEKGEILGRVKITEAKQNEFIFYDFEIPENPNHTGEVILQQLDDGRTKVIFTFDSAESQYPYQVYYYLIKNKIQKKIEENLIQLEKYLSENTSNTTQKLRDTPVEVSVENQKILGFVQETSFSEEEFNMAKEESLAMLYSYLKDSQRLSDEVIGNAYTYYIKYDASRNLKSMIFGYPVEQEIELVDGMQYYPVEGGKALTLKYNPRLSNLKKTLTKLRNFANQEKLVLGNRFWEEELPNDEIQVFYVLESN